MSQSCAVKVLYMLRCYLFPSKGHTQCTAHQSVYGNCLLLHYAVQTWAKAHRHKGNYSLPSQTVQVLQIETTWHNWSGIFSRLLNVFNKQKICNFDCYLIPIFPKNDKLSTLDVDRIMLTGALVAVVVAKWWKMVKDVLMYVLTSEHQKQRWRDRRRVSFVG